MKIENDLGRDDIRRLVLRLAIPSMLAQFINVLYSVVDRIYIGNIPVIGETALAGVGVSGPIVTLISAFAYLVGLGGSPLMSIRMGEGQDEKAKKILANSFWMIVGLSSVLTLVLFVFKREILTRFGASEAILPYAESYFTIYLLGTVFALLSIGAGYLNSDVAQRAASGADRNDFGGARCGNEYCAGSSVYFCV